MASRTTSRTNAEITAATRARLIKAARELFAQRGFAGVTGDEIAAKAGLTRGALYYQFGGVEGLFAECARTIAREVVEALYVQTMKSSPAEVDELEIGSRLLLDAFSAPETAAILLRDAPGVLGFAAWMELMEASGLVASIDHALEHWVEAGLLPASRKTPTVRLLFGATVQAAQAIAEAPKPKKAAAMYRQSVAGLIRGLKNSGSA
jgi:AcrR family transcriptional regulator